MAVYGGPDIVTDGLVLCLDAGNSRSYPGSGATWTDLSGNGNNGTLVNGVNYNSANKGSLVFDGVNDYVSLTNNDGLGNSFSSFSIDLTIRPRTGTGDTNIGYLLHRGISAIIGDSVYTIAMNNNALTFYINGSSNLLQLNNKNNILANYCYVWNGSVLSSYINGIFNSSINFATFTNTRIGSTATIGSTSINPGYRPGNCDLFNLKIYDEALTPKQILDNYRATKGRFGL